jgi:hypothetical protein
MAQQPQEAEQPSIAVWVLQSRDQSLSRQAAVFLQVIARTVERDLPSSCLSGS